MNIKEICKEYGVDYKKFMECVWQSTKFILFGAQAEGIGTIPVEYLLSYMIIGITTTLEHHDLPKNICELLNQFIEFKSKNKEGGVLH